MNRYFLPSFLFSITPFLVFAESGMNPSNSLTFRGLITYFLDIIGLLIPILFALAFIVFFWGLSKFILNSGSSAEIQKGKTYMIWGVLALFILLTFRVIITFVSNDLGLGGDANVIPLLPTGGGTDVNSRVIFDPENGPGGFVPNP